MSQYQSSSLRVVYCQEVSSLANFREEFKGHLQEPPSHQPSTVQTVAKLRPCNLGSFAAFFGTSKTFPLQTEGPKIGRVLFSDLNF